MANFGFSVDDVVPLIDLALDIYNSSKQAGKEFQSLTDDVGSFRICLEHLRIEAEKPDSIVYRSSRSQQEELVAFLKTCRVDLESMEIPPTNFQSLKHTPEKWDRLGCSLKTQAEIQAKIATNSDRLNSFLHGLHTSALHRVEEDTERHTLPSGKIRDKLNAIRQDVLAGRRDASITMGIDDWITLEQELIDDNVTRVDVETNKYEIEQWLEHTKRMIGMDDVSQDTVGKEENQATTTLPVEYQMPRHDNSTHSSHTQDERTPSTFRLPNPSSKQAVVDYHSDDSNSAFEPEAYGEQQESENDTTSDIVFDASNLPIIEVYCDGSPGLLTRPDKSEDENSDGEDKEDSEESDTISIVSSYTDYNDNGISVIYPDNDDRCTKSTDFLGPPPVVETPPPDVEFIGAHFCEAVADKTREWGVEPDTALASDRMQAIFAKQKDLIGIHQRRDSHPSLDEERTQNTGLDYVIYRHEVEQCDRPISTHNVTARDLFDNWYEMSYLPSKPQACAAPEPKALVTLRHAYWFPKHLDISVADVQYGVDKKIEVFRGSHNPFRMEGLIEIGVVKVSMEKYVHGRND